MLLEITHHNTFEYSEPVSESHVEFRLTPLTDGSQHLLQHRQRSNPATSIRQYRDGLGNTVTYLNYMDAHERLEVVFESVVETFPSRYRGNGIPGELRATPATSALLHDYLQPTALSNWSGLFRDFATPLENLRRLPTQEATEQIREIIHRSFRYDGDVTNVTSSIEDILTHRAGVCQDFTHLMLATCRYLGFPARYVSGYTLPDTPGEGAAASHAWCEVFDPDHGWFGVDPTHNQWVEENHVRLGIGRDYRDVPPNRGVYRGAGVEDMRVTVFIRPITAEELDSRARVLYRAPRVVPPATRSTRKAPPTSIVQQAMMVQQQQQQQQQ